MQLQQISTPTRVDGNTKSTKHFHQTQGDPSGLDFAHSGQFVGYESPGVQLNNQLVDLKDMSHLIKQVIESDDKNAIDNLVIQFSKEVTERSQLNQKRLQSSAGSKEEETDHNISDTNLAAVTINDKANMLEQMTLNSELTPPTVKQFLNGQEQQGNLSQIQVQDREFYSFTDNQTERNLLNDIKTNMKTKEDMQDYLTSVKHHLDVNVQDAIRLKQTFQQKTQGTPYKFVDQQSLQLSEPSNLESSNRQQQQRYNIDKIEVRGPKQSKRQVKQQDSGGDGIGEDGGDAGSCDENNEQAFSRSSRNINNNELVSQLVLKDKQIQEMSVQLVQKQIFELQNQRLALRLMQINERYEQTTKTLLKQQQREECILQKIKESDVLGSAFFYYYLQQSPNQDEVRGFKMKQHSPRTKEVSRKRKSPSPHPQLQQQKLKSKKIKDNYFEEDDFPNGGSVGGGEDNREEEDEHQDDDDDNEKCRDGGRIDGGKRGEKAKKMRGMGRVRDQQQDKKGNREVEIMAQKRQVNTEFIFISLSGIILSLFQSLEDDIPLLKIDLRQINRVSYQESQNIIKFSLLTDYQLLNPHILGLKFENRKDFLKWDKSLYIAICRERLKQNTPLFSNSELPKVLYSVEEETDQKTADYEFRELVIEGINSALDQEVITKVSPKKFVPNDVSSNDKDIYPLKSSEWGRPSPEKFHELSSNPFADKQVSHALLEKYDQSKNTKQCKEKDDDYYDKEVKILQNGSELDAEEGDQAQEEDKEVNEVEQKQLQKTTDFKFQVEESQILYGSQLIHYENENEQQNKGLQSSHSASNLQQQQQQQKANVKQIFSNQLTPTRSAANNLKKQVLPIQQQPQPQNQQVIQAPRTPSSKNSENNQQQQPVGELNPEFKFMRALTILKNGMTFVKYSKWPTDPHERLVFLSADSCFLCWQDPSERKEKSISLDQIQEIRLGRNSPSFKRYNQNFNSLNQLNHSDECCLAIVTNQNRYLELEASSKEIRQKLIQNLLIVLSSKNKEFKINTHSQQHYQYYSIYKLY